MAADRCRLRAKREGQGKQAVAIELFVIMHKLCCFRHQFSREHPWRVDADWAKERVRSAGSCSRTPPTRPGTSISPFTINLALQKRAGTREDSSIETATNVKGLTSPFSGSLWVAPEGELHHREHYP